MSRSRQYLIALAAVFAISVASTALASAQASPNNSSLSTFVYVSSSPSTGSYQINGYAAAADGSLTPLAGSPFAGNVSYLAANKNYLFGTNGTDIDSFSVASDGAIAQAFSINAEQLNSGSCGGPINLFLDLTGTTLYDLDYLGSGCANNAYQHFSVNNSTGALAYKGAVQASPGFETPLTFIGNNKYGYSATCYHFGPQIFGYLRNASGSLTYMPNLNPAIPEGPPGQEYCPGITTTDHYNHIAVALAPILDTDWQSSGTETLGLYSADSSGNLTTASTYENMPITAMNNIMDMKTSVSGKLIAVGGDNGLAVYQFNGSNPITYVAGLVNEVPINEVFWDNSGNLYALSSNFSLLWVFTKDFNPAPGSPYSIPGAQNMAVFTRN